MDGLASIGETLIVQSDPANAGLVAYVWWRLDRRLTELRDRLPEEPPGER
jgi:hypothetical protein